MMFYKRFLRRISEDAYLYSHEINTPEEEETPKLYKMSKYPKINTNKYNYFNYKKTLKVNGK